MKKMELLSPAGSPEALRASVENGADAVYLGLSGFNARRGAENFDAQALNQAVQYCHLRGVRVYVTVNTLVRQDELFSLEALIVSLQDACVDAVIVQDLGAAEAFRRVSSEIPLHASTQMAVHNRLGVQYLKRAGFARAVLAREMTREEIAACKDCGVELEVFCHGALCVSCSGQCLFSSMVGARSGNRGMCAQPCRLPYALENAKGHLLSTRDLALITQLDALCESGVTSLKIEGRMRRSEYVAVVTGIYRRALDGHAVTPDDIEALDQIFNRGGGTTGYFNGVCEEELINPARPNHFGVFIGKCETQNHVRTMRPVDADDLLVLRRNGMDDLPVKLPSASAGVLHLPGAQPGDALIRLVSHRQMALAKESFRAPKRQVPVSAKLAFNIGAPARLTLNRGEAAFTAVGREVLPAQTAPLDAQSVQARLKKTGGTAFFIENFEIDMDLSAYLPVSSINALRRDAIAGLESQLLSSAKPSHAPRRLPVPSALPVSGKTQLLAQSGDIAVLLRAQKSGADEIIYAPADFRRDALETAKQALLGTRFSLALPQVLDNDALLTLHRWAKSLGAELISVYASNVGHFSLAWDVPLRGDYSLNIANTLSVDALFAMGVTRFTPSLELTCAQIAALGGANELVVYGRIPLMQLKNCPLRVARGDKGPHALCKRCDFGEASIDTKALIDRKGIAFPLRRNVSPAGCVVQVLNSVPLFLMRHAQKLPPANAWRLILAGGDDVENIVSLHREILRGGSGSDYPMFFDKMPATTGHYFRGVE